jgi:hypothetical protein
MNKSFLALTIALDKLRNKLLKHRSRSINMVPIWGQISITNKTRKTCIKALKTWGNKDWLERYDIPKSKSSMHIHFVRHENAGHVTRALRLYRSMLTDKKIADRAIREIERKVKEVDNG